MVTNTQLAESLRTETAALSQQIRQLTQRLNSLYTIYTKSIKNMSRIIESQNDEIKKTQESNNQLEEALVHTLRAIKKNVEYQTWYPACGGHPEMYVAGMHPSYLER
jgi:ABC-type transporter Mla subunit MlaD